MALAPIGLEAIVRGVSRFNAGVTQMNRRIHLFGSTARRSGRSTGGLANSVDRLGNSITRVGQAATRAGIAMSFLVTAPIVTAFAAATNAAVKFEDEIVKIATLADIPGAAIASTRNEILGLADANSTLGLAVETGRSAVELASAAYFIYSSDVRDATVANEILEASAKAAAIGLGDTEVIANALTSVIGAYGDSAIDAGEATDILLTAVQRGKAEADQFAGSLDKVLPLAASLGVEFDEVAAFIATYTVGGATAAEATNGLRRALISIINPTGDAEKAFAAIGTSGEKLTEQLGRDGLQPTLFALGRALEEAGIPAIEVFGRIEGLNAVLFDTGPAAESYVENAQAITNSNGALEKSFSIVQQTTGFQLNQLKASFEVLGITIGSIFLPAINRLVQRLLPAIQAVAKFADSHPKLVLVATALALVAAAIGPLLVAIGFAITAFGTIVGAIGGFLGVLGSLISPIGVVVVAVLALGAALAVGLAAGFQQLAKTADDAGQFFRDLGNRALNWGKNIVLQLAKGIIRGITFVVQAIAQLGRVIASFLSPGSPPALLPDLPEWGQSAMEEFLRGFTLADFSLFNEISDTIEQFFRSFAEEGSQTLIPAIIQMRTGLAEAIAQIREMGDVSSAAIAEIVTNLGLANADLEAYVQTMLELEQASEAVKEIQEEIAEVNRGFDALVDPLNEELEAIRDRRQEFENQQEIADLQEALQDPDLTGQERQLVLDRLRELQILDQVDALEDARDAQIEELETQLELAEAERQRLEDQAAAQQALIEAQIENNDLLREQLDLLEQVADAISDAAGGLGDELASVGEPLDLEGAVPEIGLDPCALLCGDDPDCDCDDPFNLDTINENAEAALNELVNNVTSFFGPLQEDIDDLKEAWENLGAAWGPVVQSIIDGTVLDEPKARLQELVDFIADIPAVAFLADWGTRFGANLAEQFGALADAGVAASQGDWEEAGRQVGQFLLSALESFFLVGELIGTALAALLGSMVKWFSEQDWPALWNSFITSTGQFLSGLWEFFARHFVFFLRKMTAWFDTQDWQSLGRTAMNFVLGGMAIIFNFITVTLPQWLRRLVKWIGKKFSPTARKEAQQAGDGLIQGIIDGMLSLDQAMRDALNGIISGAMQAAVDAAQAIWQGFLDWLFASLPDFPGLGDQLPGGGGGGAPPGSGGGTPPTGPPGGGGRQGTNRFGFSIPAIAGPGRVSAPTVMSNTVNNTFNTTINNGRDEAWFRRLIRQEVAEAIRSK